MRRSPDLELLLPVLASFLLLKPYACLGFLPPETFQPRSSPFPLHAKGKAASQDISNTANIKGLVQNLFSVCAHLQNPSLYAPSWADHALLREQDDAIRLITSDPVSSGTILSLYPLDALGMRSTRQKKKKLKKSVKTKEETRDFLVFDQDKDGPYFQAMLSQSLQKSSPIITDYRLHVPLTFATDDNTNETIIHQQELFADINPTNLLDPSPGWMGHLATKTKHVKQANCVVVPLTAASPLCALVATKDLEEGTELVSLLPELLPPDVAQHYSAVVGQKYETELQELAGYLAMAYPPPLRPVVPTSSQDHEKEPQLKAPFYTINLEYPGIRYAHKDPDVIIIDDFLTEEECDRITKNAKSHMIPCVTKDPVTGAVQEDASRTSTNANLPQSDVPTIVEKLVRLTNCPDPTHLETLQILRYTQGQRFYPHTDGFQGPTTACGFQNSGRLVTIFCYLNDVDEGGETRFTQLLPEPLSIAPRKGMAVLHFPATTGLEEDPRVEHEGSVASDEKWLLVSWLWRDPRTDPQYAEDVFPSIMGSC